MKIKEGFMLREVCGSFVVVAIGEMADKFNGMISLNASGKFLFERLLKGATVESLCDDLCAEYDVSKEKALQDIQKFVDALEKANVIDK